ncbi:hypothetical protein ACQEVZ_24620 [Dactylosporangium sp. CA-152071]|uniref:hypothetical protein n=1 Tax=Dactylosporangium sp. CA-152071 TaxID=3239933 RepID=UPI003D94FDD3
MLVFDATALVGLFNSHPTVFMLWQRADEGATEIVVPALAIVEAGATLKTSTTAWDRFLWMPTITVLPLGERAAVEIAGWSGTFAARHALWEARALDCPLVTQDPDLYGPGLADIQVV